MTLTLRTCAVRSWHPSDVDSLTVHANNRNVAINLRDRFPSPYTRRDGREFIKMARRMKPESFFAIAVGGEAVGGIGFVPGHDVERVSSEIGYWLGEAFWGRGIMTAAVRATVEHLFRHFDFMRLEAPVFEWNPASMRVLEKCGFAREGVLRKSIEKDGQIIDAVLYARLR